MMQSFFKMKYDLRLDGTTFMLFGCVASESCTGFFPSGADSVLRGSGADTCSSESPLKNANNFLPLRHNTQEGGRLSYYS